MSAVLLCQGTALALPLKDASVHCCVTSPPYFGLRDYQTGTWQGGDAACTHVHGLARHDAKNGRHNSSTFHGSMSTEHGGGHTYYTNVCGRCSATRVDQQLGLEDSVEAYVAAMVQVFREVWRVMRDDGTCWVNIGDTMRDKQLLGLPWRLALALQANGWILRSEIIWSKLNPMPESVQDRVVRSHEQVFLFSKQARYFYDATAVAEPSASPVPASRLPSGTYSAMSGRNDDGRHRSGGFVTDATRACRSVWSLASEPLVGFQHYAAFPQALVRRCLLAGAPSQVCAACGAPYRRVVERQTHAPVYRSTNTPIRYLAASTAGQGTNGTGESTLGMVQHVTTTGLEPTCACAAGGAPSVVLDCFAGSGTTLLVARELGHHAVGVDLSYPYLHDIARTRLGLAQLAAWTGDAPAPAPVVTYHDLPLFGGF